MNEEKAADCPTVSFTTDMCQVECPAVSFTTDMRQVDGPTPASIPLRPLPELIDFVVGWTAEQCYKWFDWKKGEK